MLRMKRTAKIAVVIVVLALVALMFFLKNGFGRGEETEKAVETSVTSPSVKEDKKDATPTAEAESVIAEEKEQLGMTQEEFDIEKWLEPGLPLLIDFGSKTCGPCQKMKPDLTAFHEEMKGKMTVVYLDVWEDPARTGGLPANVVPTQYFFNPDGTPYMPTEDIQMKYYGFMQYTVKGSDEIVLTSHQGVLFLDGLREIAAEMGVEI